MCVLVTVLLAVLNLFCAGVFLILFATMLIKKISKGKDLLGGINVGAVPPVTEFT